MKKKLFYGFAVLAIAAVAAFNANVSSQKGILSDISLENVEALADIEDAGVLCSSEVGKLICPINNDKTKWVLFYAG